MRWFVALLFAFASLDAVEVIAHQVSNENNTTKAKGDVVILDGKYFIRSDNLIKNGDELELFGNVYSYEPNGDYSLSDYLFIQNKHRAYGDNIFYYFAGNGLWLSASEAKKEGNISTAKSGAVSGCLASSPDWSIRFTTAKIYKEDEWLALYNPLFYAGRVPIFYSPYFGHYTNKKRRSGLLMPSIGHSKKEGFLYGQPIYFAPHDQFDLEITPQNRSDRGAGTTSEFRFVDSPYSKGNIIYGEFKDNSKYTKENSIVRPKHWGKRINYKRSRIFATPSSNSQEGLVLRYDELSDVEFRALEKVEFGVKAIDTSALVTNKLDYFYKNNHLYGGIYTRDFKNLENKELDKTTVQITPELHGHLFSRSILTDNLIVSVDTKAKNYTRTKGDEAKDLSIIAPASYSLSLFDDYLKATFNYQTSYYQINYSNKSYKTGKETTQKAGATVETLLAKPYDSFFHTVGASASYLDPFSNKIKGDFNRDFVQKNLQEEDINHPSLSFKFQQYFHDNSGLNVLSHRVNQAMIVDENNTLLDLENEITIKPISSLSLTNTIKYSHDFDAITSSRTTFAKSGDFGLGINHIYENKDGKRVTKRYISLNSSYKINGRHHIKGEFQRDLLANENRGWMVAHTYDKKCWRSELSLHKKISPYTTGSGSTRSRIDDTIFLKLTLVPFGDLNQQLYKKERY